MAKRSCAWTGSAAALDFAATGAKLRLDPWDGAVYTATLAPEGKFAPVVANLGPSPLAFAQFPSDKDGKLTTLRLTFADGQAYDFKRGRERHEQNDFWHRQRSRKAGWTATP